MPRPATDMSGRLAATMRKTFAPVVGLVGAEQARMDARMAALCARLDTIGEDRGAAPFRPDIPEHR